MDEQAARREDFLTSPERRILVIPHLGDPAATTAGFSIARQLKAKQINTCAVVEGMPSDEAEKLSQRADVRVAPAEHPALLTLHTAIFAGLALTRILFEQRVRTAGGSEKEKVYAERMAPNLNPFREWEGFQKANSQALQSQIIDTQTLQFLWSSAVAGSEKPIMDLLRNVRTNAERFLPLQGIGGNVARWWTEQPPATQKEMFVPFEGSAFANLGEKSVWESIRHLEKFDRTLALYRCDVLGGRIGGESFTAAIFLVGKPMWDLGLLPWILLRTGLRVFLWAPSKEKQ